MKVKALKRGTYPNGHEREAGDVFDYDGPTQITRGGKKVNYFPSWMKPMEPAPPKADAVSPQQGTEGNADALRQEYELVMGKKPHHLKSPETLRKEIDEAIKAKSE